MKKHKIDRYLIRTILFSFIAAGISFGYFIIKDKGFFTIIDDFNAQQLPFATAVWNMFHSGDIGAWSWNIDLGSSFINTFSFYDLGSPFIWLSLLAPRGAFPYLAGFLYIAKYVVAAATAYLYLRLFLHDRKWGVVGALLYAFSGYQATNLEYFHFHDVVAFFPLLLLGLELAMKDKKYRPFFVFTVFINCLLNYYFFVGEAIFLIIYYLVRYRELPVRQFLSGVLSCVLCGALGVGMAAVLFIPNILYVLGNARGQNKLHLEDFVYSSADLLHIIKGLLFPGESMRDLSAVLPQDWRSTSAYLPFFGMSMVFAYLCSKKKTWLRWLLLILGAISLFPLSDSVFLMFSEASQRWWYMFVLIMALTTAIVLDNREDYPIKKASLLYIGMLTVFYFTIRLVQWNSNGDYAVYHPARFCLLYLIALVGPMLFLLLKNQKWLSYRSMLILTMCGCIVTTGLTLHFYRIVAINPAEYRENFEAGLNLKTLDAQYRYNSINNEMMITGDAAGIGVFCTTIENSSREFDTLFGRYSGNTTQNRADITGMSELLGGKYKITKDSSSSGIVDSVTGAGTTFYITEGSACPIGFAVDQVLTADTFMSIPLEKKALALMQAAIVDESQQDQLKDVATNVSAEQLDYQDMDALIEQTVENKVQDFHRDSHGFQCTTSYAKNRLVYFTVPWSEGWQATIDGKQSEIINSGGMMAIVVPSGEHDVVFSYHTPGFHMGVIVSAVSLCIFVVVTGFTIRKRKRAL